jgi:hypothetical protein
MKSRRDLGPSSCLHAGVALAMTLVCVLVAVGPSAAFAKWNFQDQSGNSVKSGDSDKSGDSGKSKDDASTTRLKIQVTDPNDKPVGNASVYVRFNQVVGPFHKDKLAELNLKTNDDGSVKVPEVPQGKIMIQVVAKGLHTFGKWYDINKSEDTIQIKLENAPHWY